MRRPPIVLQAPDGDRMEQSHLHIFTSFSKLDHQSIVSILILPSIAVLPTLSKFTLAAAARPLADALQSLKGLKFSSIALKSEGLRRQRYISALHP